MSMQDVLGELSGATRALQAKEHNAVLVPIHVPPADLDGFMAGMSLARNVDGIIVTVPDKFAARAHCATVSERACFLHAVNVMRRAPGGSWHGDMFDGLAFVATLGDAGCELRSKRALLVGAGGVGSAIAHALLLAGIGALAIHDGDVERRDALIRRLATLDAAPVTAGSADPTGFDVVCNATPMGMRPDDPLPILVERLQPQMFGGDVITVPAVPPLIEAARQLGCGTQTGTGMFERVRDLMLEFLLGGWRQQGRRLA
jgi:shikimate dehydrogenase